MFRFSFEHFQRPRLVGVVSVIVAVALGLAYMAAAGAPMNFLVMNVAALIAGLIILAVIVRIETRAPWRPGAAGLALSLALLATSLFGNSVEGASRWFSAGPLFMQTSLLILPLMIMDFAKSRNVVSTAGMVIAAMALALQPDRAMASVLLAGMVALTLFHFDRLAGVALVSAAVAVLATFAQPDTLPAVPYVDQIFYSAFAVHPLAGLAVWCGAAALLAPAFNGWRNGREQARLVVFGAVWLTVILAAALGNYPTPVVGYGGSSIIGYLLCLAALPMRVADVSPEMSNDDDAQDRGRADASRPNFPRVSVSPAQAGVQPITKETRVARL